MKKYIPTNLAITIMNQLLSRFMDMYDDKNAQLATEYIQLEFKRYGIMGNDREVTTDDTTPDTETNDSEPSDDTGAASDSNNVPD